MASEELDLLEYELERRRVAEPLRFFKPNGAQERFLNAVADPTNNIIVFPAGNWTGKTCAAVAAVAAFAYPNMAEDKVFDKPIFKDWASTGYPKRARILSTPKELEDIGSIQTEIKKWFPAGRYTANKKGKQYPCEFTTDTGWVIDVMSYEQAVSEFEGTTVGVFVFNEPPPEAIFNACMSRRKFGAITMMPMTPLTNSAWIYDRLVSKDGTDKIKVIYGETEEACCEHGNGNGVIPHAAIVDLERNCDPDEREGRLRGRFMHLAGQIYKTFNRDVHTFKLDTDLTNFLSGKETYMVCDPAIGKPLACIWAAVDATGTLWIYDEYPLGIEFQGAKDSNLTVVDYAELFKSKEEGRKIQTRILDRHFGNSRRTLGGLTLKQEFGEAGIDFMDSYTSDDKTEIETGILKVKELLRYNKDKPIDNLNRPRIMVADHLTNVIHAFERWRRDQKTGKPMEEYKDFSDCIRYLAMAGPEIEAYKPWDVKPTHYGVGN